MRQNVSNTIIVIPARMAATRLPGKPLRQIGDAPMIVKVWRRAVAADIGRVIVACDGDAIADIIRAEGGEAVITDPDLPSGSDRVAAALTRIDPDKSYEYVINLQGDLPETTLKCCHSSILPFIKMHLISLPCCFADSSRKRTGSRGQSRGVMAGRRYRGNRLGDIF